MKITSLTSLDTVSPSKEGAWYPLLGTDSEYIEVEGEEGVFEIKILGPDSIEARSAQAFYYQEVKGEDQAKIMEAQAKFCSEVVVDWKNAGDKFDKQGIYDLAKRFPFVFVQVFKFATDRKAFLVLKGSKD